jgi:hypothetical protein
VQKEIDEARDGYMTLVLCTSTSIIPPSNRVPQVGGNEDACSDIPAAEALSLTWYHSGHPVLQPTIRLA